MSKLKTQIRNVHVQEKNCEYCHYGMMEGKYVHCTKHVPLDKRPHSSNKITCEKFAKKDVTFYYNPIEKRFLKKKIYRKSKVHKPTKRNELNLSGLKLEKICK